ncbi:MAG: alpha/beta hydrolase [Deltaproteobacteria bacterium]|nr:alpha/beta hydrolase [Deltaproteobacteria bacterium]
MPSTHVNGIDIAYDIDGTGDPLLMIMGITGSKYHWLGFEKKFRLDYMTVRFDNRGVGETSAPPPPYPMKQMAGDVAGLLDALAIERAHVFGVSMGGMIAQEFAIGWPNRVRSLVLGCTHFGGLKQIHPPLEVQERAFIVAGKGADRAMRDILSVNLTPRFMEKRPDVVEHLMKYGLEHRMKREGFAGQLYAVSDHDTADRLGAIKVPVMVIAGDEDELIPPLNSVEIAGLIPQAQLTMLPGIGHMFWIEAPDDAAHHIRRFLK